MIPTVRVYASEEAGQAARRDAEQAGFDKVALLTPTAAAGREAEAVAAAVESQAIGGGQSRLCIDALKRGQTVVGVFAPFGMGQKAEAVLDRHGPAEALEPPPRRSPAPLSKALGIPVLSNAKPVTDLSIFRFILGEPKLSQKAAPLSSMVGMKTLTAAKSKKSSLGLPLLSNKAAPFSGMFGLPLLTRSKDKSRSFGLPLLTDNPTPFSSLFGMRVLSKKDESDRR